jgi:hexosaminidase
VRKFAQEAKARRIEIIPLVQTLGHMETPLSLPEYAHLREIPYRSDCLNPLAKGAQRLVAAMIFDVLTLLPDVKRFHLGGDESWTFGKAPDTAKFVKKHGKAALYRRHIEPILHMLADRGVRPILWSDMMHDWPMAELRQFAKRVDLCPWGYRGHPDQWQFHSATKYIERFAQAGATLWGATAYKGGEGHNTDLADFAVREENAKAWAEVGARFGSVGLFATAWSRYSTHRMQDDPIDAHLDTLVHVGLILSTGRAPGREKCLEVLEELGETKRFEACRAALEKLAKARQLGWRAVQWTREQIVTSTEDPRRRGSGMTLRFLLDLRRALYEASDASQEMQKAFRGLMPPVWIDRYLSERIEPLMEEYAALDGRARVLEPEAYWNTIGESKWGGG